MGQGCTSVRVLAMHSGQRHQNFKKVRSVISCLVVSPKGRMKEASGGFLRGCFLMLAETWTSDYPPAKD